MEYTLNKIIAIRGDESDRVDGTTCIAVTEYKWFIEQVRKVEEVEAERNYWKMKCLLMQRQ